ncbi:MAG: DUF2281 domain-containing protein [Moorea sp. SIO2I5]|nr:DUF2281 domain-containing protein [Moorena sp. SIO2I5]
MFDERVVMNYQTIGLPKEFLKSLQALPPQQQRMVFDFVEFLALKYVKSEPSQSQAPRISGLLEGQGWISDDFNEPLSDEFWFGENDPLSDQSQAG